MVARTAGKCRKTGSRDKSTIKRRVSKYKFYLTAVALCTHLYPCLCVCQEKKIINALLSSTLSIVHSHHMVRHFRFSWWILSIRVRREQMKKSESMRGAVQKHRIVDNRSTVNRNSHCYSFNRSNSFHPAMQLRQQQ